MARYALLTLSLRLAALVSTDVYAYAPLSPLFGRGRSCVAPTRSGAAVKSPPSSYAAGMSPQRAAAEDTPADDPDPSPIYIVPSAKAIELKESLIASVKRLRTLMDRDGDFAVDFGVKGGELNATTRAPQKVDYYSISEDVGHAAQDVMDICDRLSQVSPLEEPTQYLGDRKDGSLAPLNGAWKLLFTTAADASFSKNSTRGDAKVQNVVDGKRGRITNVIDFSKKEDGSEPVLKQLNVVIKATPVSDKRVSLQFRYAKAVLTKFFFFPLFGRKLALYIPVPGPFITRLLVLLGRVLRFGRKGAAKKVPKAYFDVLYLDSDLRVHKTGDDNFFVQGRESWFEAKPYFQ